jgi:hypothetical protein
MTDAVYSEIQTALSVFSKFFCPGHCTVYLLCSFSLTRLCLFSSFLFIKLLSVISGFCLRVAENCVLGYYTASSNFLLTFWNNLSVPSSGFKNPKQSLYPRCRIYVEEHGWWRVSIGQCQPVGLLWVVVLYFVFTTIVILVFTYLFFVLLVCYLLLALVPALYSATEYGVSCLCTWYFYQARVLGYDFCPAIVLF